MQNCRRNWSCRDLLTFNCTSLTQVVTSGDGSPLFWKCKESFYQLRSKHRLQKPRYHCGSPKTYELSQLYCIVCKYLIGGVSELLWNTFDIVYRWSWPQGQTKNNRDTHITHTSTFSFSFTHFLCPYHIVSYPTLQPLCDFALSFFFFFFYINESHHSGLAQNLITSEDIHEVACMCSHADTYMSAHACIHTHPHTITSSHCVFKVATCCFVPPGLLCLSGGSDTAV